jgi:hypothetical protein
MTSKIGWPMWIGVVAADLGRLRDFYGRVMGLSEHEAGSDWIQFELGDRRLLEIIAQDPGAPEYRKPPGGVRGERHPRGERRSGCTWRGGHHRRPRRPRLVEPLEVLLGRGRKRVRAQPAALRWV